MLRFRTATGSSNPDGSNRMRQPVGNGNLAPYTFVNGANRCLTTVKRRWVAKDADRTKIRLRYGNFVSSGVTEITSYPDLVIKCGIALTYGGAITRGKFTAANEMVLIGGEIKETDDIDITLTKNTPFYEVCRRVYPLLYKTRTSPFVVGMVVTGGTSGATGTIARMTEGTTGSLTLTGESGTFVDGETLTGVLSGYTNGVAVADLVTIQQQIYTVSSHSIWNEGIIGNNNTSIDYTAAFPNTLPALTASMNGSGVITSVSGTGGTGNSAALTLAAYEYVNNVLYIKGIGYSSVSAGAISGNTVTSGTPPSGLAAWGSPSVVAIGGSGFGTTSAIYCALEVTGIPSKAVKSITVIGTSQDRGDSATDTTGDLYGNHGIERIVNNVAAINNMSRSSASASYDAQYATIYPRLYAAYMGRTTNCLITQGSNDIVVSATNSQLKGWIATIAAYTRSFNMSTDVATIIPRTSGTFTSEGGQTPVAGFAAAGVMDQYNADVLSGVVVSDNTPFNHYAFMRGVDPNKWRADGGIAYTAEGIHQSLYGFGAEAADAALAGWFSSRLT